MAAMTGQIAFVPAARRWCRAPEGALGYEEVFGPGPRVEANDERAVRPGSAQEGDEIEMMRLALRWVLVDPLRSRAWSTSPVSPLVAELGGSRSTPGALQRRRDLAVDAPSPETRRGFVARDTRHRPDEARVPRATARRWVTAHSDPNGTAALDPAALVTVDLITDTGKVGAESSWPLNLVVPRCVV